MRSRPSLWPRRPPEIAKASPFPDFLHFASSGAVDREGNRQVIQQKLNLFSHNQLLGYSDVMHSLQLRPSNDGRSTEYQAVAYMGSRRRVQRRVLGNETIGILGADLLPR